MVAAIVDRDPSQHLGEHLIPPTAPIDVLGRVALGVEPGLGDVLMLQAGHTAPDVSVATTTPIVWQEIPVAQQVPTAERLVVASQLGRHATKP